MEVYWTFSDTSSLWCHVCHTVDSLSTGDDKQEGGLADQQLQKQESDKWHPA